MAPPAAPPTPRSRAAGALVLAGGVACAWPGVTSALALGSGVALALLLGNPWRAATRKVAKKLLPLAVVGLGGGMDLGAVARVGAHGIGYSVTSIALCLALGAALARALRVERVTATLVSVGTAICGGSAIAAAAPAIGADDRQLSVALGTVFLLNAIALVLFPPIGRVAGLDEPGFGLWAALAIHDTSSVVGAGLQYGAKALEVATTVKLARALWIAPLALALGLLERRRSRAAGAGGAPVAVPWFILGFVAAAAIATYVPGARPAGRALAFAGQRALVLTLFLIGLGLDRESLRKVGARPMLLGVSLWLAMGVATFTAVALGLRAG